MSSRPGVHIGPWTSLESLAFVSEGARVPESVGTVEKLLAVRFRKILRSFSTPAELSPWVLRGFPKGHGLLGPRPRRD